MQALEAAPLPLIRSLFSPFSGRGERTRRKIGAGWANFLERAVDHPHGKTLCDAQSAGTITADFDHREWLWNPSGDPIGFKLGRFLWSPSGVPIGRFVGEEAYAPAGYYLGERILTTRFLVDTTKRGRVIVSFAPPGPGAPEVAPVAILALPPYFWPSFADFPPPP